MRVVDPHGACDAGPVRSTTTPARGAIAHVFLAIALCLPLAAAAEVLDASMAQHPGMLDTSLLVLLAIGFLAAVLWASLLPTVRQVEVSTARSLLGHDDAALPDVRFPRAWSSRRRGAAWLATLATVGLVVTAAVVYLVPAGVELASFPFSGDTAVTWPGTGHRTHVGSGWHTGWLLVPGLVALAAGIAVVVVAARMLGALAPRVLGPTLIERVSIAADRERTLARANAVARDLHDQLGHTLTAMTVQATAARLLLATDPDAAERAITAVEELGRRAQEDVDNVVRTLRDGAPAGQAASDGPVDLVSLARALADESMLEVELRVPEAVPVDEELAGVVRALIREALTNATRHGTGSASLRLWSDAQAVQVEVRNPVRTLVPRGPDRAGLAGLHERVLLVDGEISAGADGAGAWCLRATLPRSRSEPRL
jgi:signal transduction histidine kinase